jgi:hypothetical protein
MLLLATALYVHAGRSVVWSRRQATRVAQARAESARAYEAIGRRRRFNNIIDANQGFYERWTPVVFAEEIALGADSFWERWFRHPELADQTDWWMRIYHDFHRRLGEWFLPQMVSAGVTLPVDGMLTLALALQRGDLKVGNYSALGAGGPCGPVVSAFEEPPRSGQPSSAGNNFRFDPIVETCDGLKYSVFIPGYGFDEPEPHECYVGKHYYNFVDTPFCKCVRHHTSVLHPKLTWEGVGHVALSKVFAAFERVADCCKETWKSAFQFFASLTWAGILAYALKFARLVLELIWVALPYFRFLLNAYTWVVGCVVVNLIYWRQYIRHPSTLRYCLCKRRYWPGPAGMRLEVKGTSSADRVKGNPPGVVMISSRRGGDLFEGMLGLGCVAKLNGKTVLLTNNHVMEAAVAADDIVVVSMKSGKWHAIPFNWDWAPSVLALEDDLIAFDVEDSLPCDLSIKVPHVIRFAGCNRTYSVFSADPSGWYCSLTVVAGRGTTLFHNATTTFGSSGGPILCSSGVVGIHCGGSDRAVSVPEVARKPSSYVNFGVALSFLIHKKLETPLDITGGYKELRKEDWNRLRARNMQYGDQPERRDFIMRNADGHREIATRFSYGNVCYVLRDTLSAEDSMVFDTVFKKQRNRNYEEAVASAWDAVEKAQQAREFSEDEEESETPSMVHERKVEEDKKFEDEFDQYMRMVDNEGRKPLGEQMSKLREARKKIMEMHKAMADVSTSQHYTNEMKSVVSQQLTELDRREKELKAKITEENQKRRGKAEALKAQVTAAVQKRDDEFKHQPSEAILESNQDFPPRGVAEPPPEPPQSKSLQLDNCSGSASTSGESAKSSLSASPVAEEQQAKLLAQRKKKLAWHKKQSERFQALIDGLGPEDQAKQSAALSNIRVHA